MSPLVEAATFRPVGPARPVPFAPTWEPVPPEARKRRGTLPWDILLGIDIALLILGTLFVLGLYLQQLVVGVPVVGDQEAAEVTSLWVLNFWNFVALGAIPLIWCAGTRVSPIRGTIRYLHLDRPWPAIGHGFGYAALALGVVLFLFLFIDILDIPLEDTGGADRFSSLTLPLVILTSAVAGFAEEVFYRGILQRWIGVWGQALLFGLAHIPGGMLSFVVAASAGLLFGYLVKNGRSLWLPITAHFVYDLFLLGSAYLAQQA